MVPSVSVVAGVMLAGGILMPLSGAHGQAAESVQTRFVAESPRKAVPFGSGEKLTFDVKFGPIKVGTGRMEVIGTEVVRGQEAWRTRFTVNGSALGYKVRDRLESWFDTRTLNSLRFIQDLNEGGKDRERAYEIFPESDTFIDTKDGSLQQSVADPIDDAAFLYFVRTLPLEVGDTYELNRYFRPDRNPVRIKVLRKETVEVPAGKFQTVVVQPIIKSKGIFSEKGHAEIWLTDDPRRLMVQMKTRLSFGTLNLYLRSLERGAGPDARASADGVP
jgi:hypothetical protein